MSEGKKLKKFGFISIILLVILAIVADLFSIIPAVSIIAATIFWIIFSIVAWRKGFGIVNFRKLVTPIISWIIELFPFASALPTVTVGCIIMLYLLNKEAKTGVNVIGIIKGKGGGGSTGPLYQNGVRSVTKNGPVYQNGMRMPTPPDAPSA